MAIFFMWFSLGLNLLISASLLAEPRYEGAFPFLVGLCIIGFVGAILIQLGQLKSGKIAYFIGVIPFVPIGLIGLLAARKHLDHLAYQSFLNNRNSTS